MIAKTFCPGHITGFFQICEHPEPLRSGSRGAGMCVGLGVDCEVEVQEGEGRVQVHFDSTLAKAPVTERAVSILAIPNNVDVVVDLHHKLPIGQGFGMSAAGALAASHALAETLGLKFTDAVRAAHRAEVENRTGLGDVAALSRGGITFRRKEGVLPYGQIDKINAEPEVVLCVVGKPISTAEVLADPERRRRVNAVGKECVARMAVAPTLNSLMRLSREFMTKTKLAPKEVEEAVIAAERHGQASMVMLGSSVFAVGNTDALEEELSDHGKVFRTRVDWRGPRVVS